MNTITNNTHYVVKTRRLRTYLQSKGFECKVDIDRNNPKYDIFLFPKTDQLMQEIANFTKLVHNDKIEKY